MPSRLLKGFERLRQVIIRPLQPIRVVHIVIMIAVPLSPRMGVEGQDHPVGITSRDLFLADMSPLLKMIVVIVELLRPQRKAVRMFSQQSRGLMENAQERHCVKKLFFHHASQRMILKQYSNYRYETKRFYIN